MKPPKQKPARPRPAQTRVGADNSIRVVSPSTVNSELERTNLFIDQLSAEIATWHHEHMNHLSSAQATWLGNYGAWRQRYNDFYNKNHPVQWTDFLVLSGIGSENDQWEKEAKEKQKEFKAIGGQTSVKPPPGGGGNGFLAGLSTGTLIGLGILAYVLLSPKDSQ
jgi:hypothetical protein